MSTGRNGAWEPREGVLDAMPELKSLACPTFSFFVSFDVHEEEE